MTPANLKSARRALGLTQKALAGILGYKDSNSIRRMEIDPRHGGHRPIMRPVAICVRYMLRDLREGRWTGAPPGDNS